MIFLKTQMFPAIVHNNSGKICKNGSKEGPHVRRPG